MRSNGTRIVPFGSYSITCAETEEQKIQALNDMIAAGFNIATIEDDGNNTTTKPMINRLVTLAGNNNFKLLIGSTNASNGLYLPQNTRTILPHSARP